MGLGESEKGVVRVGLVSFVCEDGVAERRIEKGDNGQNNWRTEAHDQ